MLYTRTPRIRFQEFDDNGDPLVGGQVWTYQAGTTALVTTYKNRGGGTPNTNPIVLDARGEAEVWLSDQYRYKFIICAADSTGPTHHIIKTDNDVLNAYAETITAAPAQNMFIPATAGDKVVDLAGLIGGVNVVKTDSTSHTVTVTDTSGANTIMGGTSYVLSVQRESVGLVLYPAGNDWILGMPDTQSRVFMDADLPPIVYDLAGLTGTILVVKVNTTVTPVLIYDSTPKYIMGISNYFLYAYRESVALTYNTDTGEWQTL